MRDIVVLGLRDTYFRQELYSEDYPIGDNDDEVSSKNIERGEGLAIKGVVWPLFLSVEKLLLFAQCPPPHPHHLLAFKNDLPTACTAVQVGLINCVASKANHKVFKGLRLGKHYHTLADRDHGQRDVWVEHVIGMDKRLFLAVHVAHQGLKVADAYCAAGGTVLRFGDCVHLEVAVEGVFLLLGGYWLVK